LTPVGGACYVVRAFFRGDMLIATLLAAVEKPTPLIDIDGTVFIQFAIFVVMAAVLHALVFRPYLRLQERRAQRIDGARSEGKAMQERAHAILIEYETQLTRAKQRGAEERMRLRGEGQEHERQVLARAREVGQQALAEARARAAAQRESARARLMTESAGIASAIASRILGRNL
jgi:F-type H+-transporting ATPase subunit b